jgi:hypothetical protein
MWKSDIQKVFKVVYKKQSRAKRAVAEECEAKRRAYQGLVGVPAAVPFAI